MNFQNKILAQNDLIIQIKRDNKQLKKENAQLKDKNIELQRVIEDKNSDLLFTSQENEQLKEELKSKNRIISKRLVESENEQLKQKKKEVYKWAYSLEKECKQLKQKKSELVHENCKLQNLLYVEQMNEDEADYLISNLKKEIVELKKEIVDHRVKEYRLTKILNETSDLT